MSTDDVHDGVLVPTIIHVEGIEELEARRLRRSVGIINLRDFVVVRGDVECCMCLLNIVSSGVGLRGTYRSRRYQSLVHPRCLCPNLLEHTNRNSGPASP